MSMQDPIADMLTRIRNAQSVNKPTVSMPSSKLKLAIAQILIEEGYVEAAEVEEISNSKFLTIKLKYYRQCPVISELVRVSRPGRRVYKGSQDIPPVMSGLGTAIISTSKGLMTDRKARAKGIGGELLCTVK